MLVPDVRIVNVLEQYTVEIVSVDPDIGRCSGVIVKTTEEETYILTAKHCIDVTNEEYVENKKPLFVFVSPTDDLALLVVEGFFSDKSVVTINTDEIQIDDHVYHLGFPNWDKTPYTDDGKVIRKSDDWIWAFFTSIGGCSGGGVFNEEDELIGILWGGVQYEDISFFESNKDIIKFLDLAYRKLK